MGEETHYVTTGGWWPNLRSLLERIGLVRLQEGLDDLLVVCVGLDARVEDPLELGRVERLPPARRVPVDAPSQLGEVVALGTPQAAADEGLLGFAVDVVARVRAFAPRAGEGGREVRLRVVVSAKRW